MTECSPKHGQSEYSAFTQAAFGILAVQRSGRCAVGDVRGRRRNPVIDETRRTHQNKMFGQKRKNKQK